MRIALCFIALTSCARSYGRITFSWSLQDSAGNALTCLSGEQVEIKAGSYTADFPCDDMHDTTDEILSGSYTVSFSLLDSTNTVESTGTQTLTVPDDDIVTADPIIFTVTPAVGSLQFKWTLEDTSSTQVSCLSGETVQFVIDGLDLEPSSFDCSLGEATVPGVPVGTYTGGTATLIQQDGSPEPTQAGPPAQFPIGQLTVTDGETDVINVLFAGLSD